MHKDIVRASGNVVWQPWHFNLGDHWATLQHLITRSYVTREEQLLSRWQHGKDYGPRFEEMLALIGGPERAQVSVVDRPYNTELNGYDVWATPYWPTVRTWNPSHHHSGVVYQFDGISSAEAKNPPEAELRDIMAYLRAWEDVTPLGKHMSLAEVVDELRQAKLFVGVDSGMSHIAHSVGVPTIIVEYKLPIITCHRRKPFVHARGTSELLAAVRGVLQVED